MTFTEPASQALTDRVLAALIEQTDARRAQFASYLPEARQGTLTQARAWGILRQVRGLEAPAETEAERPQRSNGGSQATSTRSNDASDAQARFAADLLRTRVAPDERVPGTVKTAAQVLAQFEASGRMSRDMARTVIDSYKDRPRPRVEAAPKAPKAAPVELEAGIYRVGDEWFKVQKAVHGSGNMYAKRLVVDEPGSAHFEFAPGAIRKLTPEHKVSLEEAQQFGQLYGVCCNCGVTLTDETSIAVGLGPYCAKKF